MQPNVNRSKKIIDYALIAASALVISTLIDVLFNKIAVEDLLRASGKIDEIAATMAIIHVAMYLYIAEIFILLIASSKNCRKWGIAGWLLTNCVGAIGLALVNIGILCNSESIHEYLFHTAGSNSGIPFYLLALLSVAIIHRIILSSRKTGG